MSKFKLVLVASNDDGSKIFAILKCDNKKVVKGHYDFDSDKFFIDRYFENNFKGLYTKKRIREILKEVLMLDRDWELA